MRCTKIVQTLMLTESLVTLTAVCLGRTWHVPGDVLTIQAALDTLSSGDTVAVAAGNYAEALQAPDSVAFTLLGIMDPDSQRPVVDPSPLNGSTHLSCLSLPTQSRAVIANFGFYNGAEMFPRENSAVGGIDNAAADLRIENCVFDSTYKGVECRLASAGTMTVSDCRFILNTRGCVRDRTPSRTSLINCDFTWHGDRALWLADSALVEDCRFPDIHSEGMEPIWLEGTGITVRGCIFGPTVTSVNSVIWTSESDGCTFEDNIFQDLEVWSAVIEYHGIVNGDGLTTFQNNIFRRTHAVQALQGGAGILLAMQIENPTASPILISGNVFDSCEARSAESFGAISMLAFNHWLEGNQFTGPGRPGPAVRKLQMDTTLAGNSSIHDCSFNGTGVALNAWRHLDAQNNWWGDQSGPYHVQFNPIGQGDTIVGIVSFDPWLWEDPFLSAPSTDTPVPSSVRLDIYPNPFNAAALLCLRVDQPGEYEVELYNLLGQRVGLLWRGPVAGEQRMVIKAEEIGSGIYFARLTRMTNGETVAVSKAVVLK